VPGAAPASASAATTHVHAVLCPRIGPSASRLPEVFNGALSERERDFTAAAAVPQGSRDPTAIRDRTRLERALSPDETLAWEARQRPRAAAAAAGAALIPLVASLALPALLSGRPTPSVLPALQNAAAPGPVGSQPSVAVGSAQYSVDNAATFIAFGALLALGALLTGYALWALARMTRARRPELGRLIVQLPILGSVLMALAYLLARVSQLTSARELLDGPRTVDAAGTTSGLAQLAAYVAVPVVIALGVAFLLVSLHAMRVGLLTRFVGVLGIVVGLAFALTVGQINPLPQSLWLALLAGLMLGRSPGGMPPAWVTGEAQPWPTQQELREARERQAEEARPAAKRDPVPLRSKDDAEPVAVGAPHPVSKKRKRKRRA